MLGIWNFLFFFPFLWIVFGLNLTTLLSLNLSEFDLDILNAIKHENPKSIRDLANKIDKDVSNVQPKVHRLANNGFISLKKGRKNSIIPYLNYDTIRLEI